MHSVKKQKILVFTAKIIGLNCIKFLLKNFREDEYTIIVCEPDSDLFIQELKKKGCHAIKLDERVLSRIRGMEDNYFDWLLNLWGGYIFKNDVLSKASQSLNIHPSYLPYCRGRDPVVWALRNALPAGVTLHTITPGVDEGDIWYREQILYTYPSTGAEVYEAVTERAWRVFCEKWPKIRVNEVVPFTQPKDGVGNTYRRKDLLLDRRIDTDKDAAAQLIFRRLLAHDFGREYQAEVIIDGQAYAAHLKLKKK